jgi:epoxyqueuosine reductase
MLLSEDVKARAREIGFDLCGIAPAGDLPELGYLSAWLDRRYYGTMTWLPRTARVRRDVRHILPSARSVIVTGTLYNTDRPYSTAEQDPARAAISRYAWGDDYHVVVGRRLDALIDWMHTSCDEVFEARRYVDTGPVQERVYAQYAGLGWIGKNACLINPALGSWLFLGVVICSLPLAPDAPGTDQCGTCQLCLQSCPTGALVEPRVLDARLCISYLTIERRGRIDEALREGLGSHVYGCDICQDVCPYNSRPVVAHGTEWQPRPTLDHPSLVTLWNMSDADLAASMAGTAMTRASVASVRRNLALAIGNAASVLPADVLDGAEAGDEARPSLREPEVADALAWAKARLAGA